jgi:hypothetical protein
VDTNRTVQSEDKVTALRAYRRARGLYQTVQAVQELWELLQVDQE